MKKSRVVLKEISIPDIKNFEQEIADFFGERNEIRNKVDAGLATQDEIDRYMNEDINFMNKYFLE